MSAIVSLSMFVRLDAGIERKGAVQMPYMPDLHYCCVCKEYLGPDNGDGICAECDVEEFEDIAEVEENG